MTKKLCLKIWSWPTPLAPRGLGEEEASELKQALSEACRENGVRDLSKDPEYEVLFQKYVQKKLVQTRPDITVKPQEVEEPNAERHSTPAQVADGGSNDGIPSRFHFAAPRRPVEVVPLPKNIQKTLDRALKSDDPAYIIKKIPRYIEKAEKFAMQECNGKPAPAQQQALYQGLVQLGTRLLILQNPVPEVPRSPEGKPNNKRRLGMEAEMLWRMRNALENPKPELVNTQAAIVVQGGLRTQDDKFRMLGTCFNLNPIAVAAREKDMGEAQEKRENLERKLLAAAPGSPEATKISRDLEHQIATVDRLTKEVSDLKAGQQRGIKTNDDIFRECQAGLVQHLENRLARNYNSYLRKAPEQ